MNSNLIITLNDVKDRCFVYSIMLAEASNSLGKMKIFFKLPAIFISILLSVLNSSKLNETEEIKIINTVMNAFIALLIGVENTLQIDNKKQVFTSTKNKFEKLSSTIEKKLLDVSNTISIEFVQNTITEFEQIDDDLTFDIPKSIQNKIKKEFFGKRTLPLILGGEKRINDVSDITKEVSAALMQNTSLISELPKILNTSQKIENSDNNNILSSSTLYTDNENFERSI